MTAYAEPVVKRMERTQEDVAEVVQQSVDTSHRGAQGPQSPSSKLAVPASEDLVPPSYPVVKMTQKLI